MLATSPTPCAKMGQVAHPDLANLGGRPRTLPPLSKGDEKAKSLIQQHELHRILENLGIGLYPTRPRSPPPPSLGQELEESQFSDCESQVPTDWDDWEAA